MVVIGYLNIEEMRDLRVFAGSRKLDMPRQRLTITDSLPNLTGISIHSRPRIPFSVGNSQISTFFHEAPAS